MEKRLLFLLVNLFLLCGGDCLKTITAKMSPNISYC